MIQIDESRLQPNWGMAQAKMVRILAFAEVGDFFMIRELTGVNYYYYYYWLNHAIHKCNLCQPRQQNIRAQSGNIGFFESVEWRVCIRIFS